MLAALDHLPPPVPSKAVGRAASPSRCHTPSLLALTIFSKLMRFSTRVWFPSWMKVMSMERWALFTGPQLPPLPAAKERCRATNSVTRACPLPLGPLPPTPHLEESPCISEASQPWSFQVTNICLRILWVFFFFLFRAEPTAYRISQARGRIRAAATSLHRSPSNTGSELLSCVCDLQHSSRQRWITDPLNEATDRTRILMDTSRIRFCCATVGTPCAS